MIRGRPAVSAVCLLLVCGECMFTMNLAGLTVGVDNRYSFTEEYCRDYIISPRAREPDILLSMTEEDAALRQKRAMDLGRRVYPLWYYESEAVHRQLCQKLPAFDAFFLHSAVISLKGDGIVLAAGVHGGKTTQLRLWQKRFGADVTVVNGDKPVLRRMEDGRVWACGTPWKGKEALGSNTMVPVKAILFLEKSGKDELATLEPLQVLEKIFYHLELPLRADTAEQMSRMLADCVERIPCYTLFCTKTVHAAETALAALRGG